MLDDILKSIECGFSLAKSGVIIVCVKFLSLIGAHRVLQSGQILVHSVLIQIQDHFQVLIL